jgi:hypothetical protein
MVTLRFPRGVPDLIQIPVLGGTTHCSIVSEFGDGKDYRILYRPPQEPGTTGPRERVREVVGTMEDNNVAPGAVLHMFLQKTGPHTSGPTGPRAVPYKRVVLHEDSSYGPRYASGSTRFGFTMNTFVPDNAIKTMGVRSKLIENGINGAPWCEGAGHGARGTPRRVACYGFGLSSFYNQDYIAIAPDDQVDLYITWNHRQTPTNMMVDGVERNYVTIMGTVMYLEGDNKGFVLNRFNAMTLHLQPDALFTESLAMWVTLRQLPDDADAVSFSRSCVSLAPQHGAHGTPQPPAPGDVKGGDEDDDDDKDGAVQLAIARSIRPLSQDVWARTKLEAAIDEDEGDLAALEAQLEELGEERDRIMETYPEDPTLVNRWKDREALELVLGEMMDINNRIGNLKRKLAANKAKLGDRETPQPQQSGVKTKTKAKAKARSITGEDGPSGAGSSKDGMEI